MGKDNKERGARGEAKISTKYQQNLLNYHDRREYIPWQVRNADTIIERTVIDRARFYHPAFWLVLIVLPI